MSLTHDIMHTSSLTYSFYHNCFLFTCIVYLFIYFVYYFGGKKMNQFTCLYGRVVCRGIYSDIQLKYLLSETKYCRDFFLKIYF